MQKELSKTEIRAFTDTIAQDDDTFILRDAIFNDVVSISGARAKLILFQNVTFKSNVFYRKPKDKEIRLTFEECLFEANVELELLVLEVLNFSSCTGNFIYLKQIEVANSLFIHNSTFKHAYIEDLRASTVSIAGNRNTNVSFFGIRCGLEMAIHLNGENSNIYINPVELHAEGSFVEHLTLRAMPTFNGLLSVQDLGINKLSIDGKIDKGLMELSNCSLYSIKIDKLTNNGTLKFSSPVIQEESTLEVTDSDLGKAVLFDIDFRKFAHVYIRSANLNDMVYSGVTWCTRIQNSADQKMTDAQLRESYKQLKNVVARQNDKPEELRFLSLEMRSFNRQLWNSPKRWNDKIIVGFNQLTNDHGQSWRRPFGIILVLVLGMYFPIKYLLGFTHFSLGSSLTAIAEMMECFNPVRKFSDSFGLDGKIPNTQRASLAKIIDIVMLRLVLGLLIFQMVKAFRKFVK